MTTRLILVRHAETVWNRQGRVQGYADSPLSNEGAIQARLLGKRLKPEKANIVYSSDAQRCKETARLAYGGTPPSFRLLKDLRERNLGKWEGRVFSEVALQDPTGVSAYRIDAAFRPPQGETFLDMQDRVFKAIQKIRRDHVGQVVVIFTSGGSLRAAVMAAMKTDPNGWSNWATWNTGVTVLEHRSDHWRLLQFNDTAHLKDSSP